MKMQPSVNNLIYYELNVGYILHMLVWVSLGILRFVTFIPLTTLFII